MHVPSEQERIAPKKQSGFRFSGRVPKTTLRARTSIERIIVNFPRAEVRNGFEGGADMVGVPVGQQYSLQAIDAVAMEERFQGTLVVAFATAIDQPVVAIGADVRGPARSFIQNRDHDRRVGFREARQVKMSRRQQGKEVH